MRALIRMQRNFLLFLGILFAATSTMSSTAHAIVSPVGISLLPPIEFPLRSGSVIGFRFNPFLGIHQSVYGFDLGLIGNMTDKSFGGLQIAGLFNYNKGPSTVIGAQIAGIGNWNITGSEIDGIQATLGLNNNFGKGRLVGLGLGLLGNRTQGTVAGAQIGIFNQAKTVYGFQLGLCNIAGALHGIQIGLININKSGPLVFFPVMNIGF